MSAPKGVSSGTRSTKTDESGRFRLERLPGPVVRVRVKGPRPEKWASIRKRSARVDQSIVLTLERLAGLTLRGRVVDDASGQPIPSFDVKLLDGSATNSRVLAAESFHRASGHFMLEGPDGEDLNLLVAAAGYTPTRLRRAELTGTARLLIRLSEAGVLGGVVADRTSEKPIAGVGVTYGVWDGSRFHWGATVGLHNGQRTVTDADGVFRFREGERGTLFFQAAGYRRFILPPAERLTHGSDSGDLVVLLHPAESVEGYYYDNGEVMAGAPVGLFRAEETFDGKEVLDVYGYTKTDEHGRFSWDDLSPGTYLLEAASGRRDFDSRFRRRFELREGDHKEVNVGDGLGRLALSGRVFDADGKPLDRTLLALKPVFEWDYDEFAAMISADREGRFEISGLRSGAYNVEAIDHSGGEIQSISLPVLELDGDLERNFEVPIQHE